MAALTLLTILQLAASTVRAPAESSPAPMKDRMPAAITEASSQFGIPEAWIVAVIGTESAGVANAVSPKGAQGLMQLMPATWEELRKRHQLGSDVFDARDNVMAGTAYLRFLYDRFGAPGFLAAYNAGPGRYEDHLRTGTALPRETRLYVERVYQRLGQPLSIVAASVNRTEPVAWQGSPLFSQAEPEGTETRPPLASAPTPFVDTNKTQLSPPN